MSLIIENTKPGVTALVNTGQVSRPLRRQPTSTAFVIGLAPWGPVGLRQTITSFAEFVRVFGGFHALGYLADFAYIFFNLFAGRQIVAVRAAGDAAAEATITLANRAVAPADTFKFDAKYPSSTVDVSVTVSDIAGDTTNVKIVVSSDALKTTETYNSVDLRDVDELAAFNDKSKLVDVSLIIAAVAGETGRPELGTFALADGDDDAASIVADDYSAYLTQFADENLGTGQVAIPGHYSEANQVALIAHAAAYNRLALLEHELGTAYATAEADLNDHPSNYAAAYFPWIEMVKIDGTSGKKFYPPVCFAAGACAQVDRTIGTHKAPANISVPNAIDVERNGDGTSMINDAVREYLNGKNINVIGPIDGQGIKLYGARVLAEVGETRVQFVHERRVLNLIYYTAKLGYAWAVFQVVDPSGRLFRDLRSAGTNFLRSIWQGGALYGKTEAEAFVVTADESNNPAEDLEQGIVHVQLGVKISPTAEVVQINIDNVPLSQNLNVLNGGDN